MNEFDQFMTALTEETRNLIHLSMSEFDRLATAEQCAVFYKAFQDGRVECIAAAGNPNRVSFLVDGKTFFTASPTRFEIHDAAVCRDEK